MNKKVLIIGIIAILFIAGLVLLIPKESELPKIPLYPPSLNMLPSDDVTINLGLGWQMVSMPNTMNKTNIFINYNDNTYTWNEAVNNNLIANVIFTYEDNNYVEVQTVLKTHGYWIYTFVDGIYLSDDAFVLYAGKLLFDGTDDIVCDRLVLAPEYYTNEIHCSSFLATDMYEFYYNGGDLLNGQ